MTFTPDRNAEVKLFRMWVDYTPEKRAEQLCMMRAALREMRAGSAETFPPENVQAFSDLLDSLEEWHDDLTPTKGN